MPGFANDSSNRSIMWSDNVDFSGNVIPSRAVTTDGQLLIGSTAAPNIQTGSLTSPDSSMTIGYSSPNITLQVTGGTTTGKTITGNTGGALSPTAGNWNILGGGSITTSGSGSTLTTALTGLTNHNVLVGAGNSTITKVAPSATSGVPLISQGASADPAFGTAVVAGGGTGQTTLTNHGVLVGAGTNAITQLATGSAGQILRSGGAGADPSYSTATYPATAGTSANVLISDGTNFVSSAPSGVGTWVLIQTQTASNSASISFTTGITSTYTNYVFVLSNVVPATNNVNLFMQVSVNGGSTYIATNYQAGDNLFPYNSNAPSNSTSTTVMVITGGIANSDPGLSGTFWLSNITTAKPPVAYWNTMQWNSVRMSLGASYNTTTTGVNAFQWTMSSGNISTGNFSLYGIRSA